VSNGTADTFLDQRVPPEDAESVRLATVLDVHYTELVLLPDSLPGDAMSNSDPRPPMDARGATHWLFESPIVKVGRWRCRPGSREAPPVRRQPWPMLSLCHGGAYALTGSRGVRVLDSSCVFLANPDEPYRTSQAAQSGCWGSSIPVRADVLTSVTGRRGTNTPRHPWGVAEPSLSCSTRAYVLDRLLFDAVRRHDPDALAIENGAVSLVSEVLAAGAGIVPHDHDPGPSSRHRDLVEAVRELLAERVEDSLGLEEIARAAAVSPYHLCRVFKRSTGETLHRYRNRLRLRTALKPVLDGADLSAVALDSGYSSHSHFTAAFRREVFVTPSRLKALATGAQVRWLMGALETFPHSALPRPRAIFR
jgi:AraC family transcriptional regulator